MKKLDPFSWSCNPNFWSDKAKLSTQIMNTRTFLIILESVGHFFNLSDTFVIIRNLLTTFENFFATFWKLMESIPIFRLFWKTYFGFFPDILESFRFFFWYSLLGYMVFLWIEFIFSSVLFVLRSSVPIFSLEIVNGK